MAISADDRETLDALRDRFGLTFPLVADEELKIAQTYGVRQKGAHVALPSTFIADERGTIRFVKVGAHPLDRPTAAEVTAALRGLDTTQGEDR